MNGGLRAYRSLCLGCIVVILVIAACAAPPTPAVAPIVTETSEPFATVSAIQSLVQRIRGAEEPLSLKETDAPLALLAEDRVTVDASGRARLRFRDFLTVELFRDTDLQVGEPELDLQTSGLIRLRELFGHTRLELRQEVAQRVELLTDFATIKPVRTGSEVIVCHAPGVLTCVAATGGEVEVSAEGKLVTIRGGEGTYILAGEQPKDPICLNTEAVRRWMDGFRAGAEVGDLGALVASLPQVPCADATRIAAAPSPQSMVTPTEALFATATMPAVSPAATTGSTDAPSPAFVEGMVRIEGGSHKVGVDAQIPDAYHVIAREVALPAFWIDEHEATNVQYAAFLEATGHVPPAGWSGGAYRDGEGNHPAAGLSFADAQAYCAWSGKRLPSEAEWEVAGRGGADALMYPWGNEPAGDGQVWQLPSDSTYPVGSAAFNRSPFGVYDMAGNVWEWVDRPYEPVPEGQQVLRGGRYGLIRDLSYRQLAAPDDQRFTQVAGVRCAVDETGG